MAPLILLHFVLALELLFNGHMETGRGAVQAQPSPYIEGRKFNRSIKSGVVPARTIGRNGITETANLSGDGCTGLSYIRCIVRSKCEWFNSACFSKIKIDETSDSDELSDEDPGLIGADVLNRTKSNPKRFLESQLPPWETPKPSSSNVDVYSIVGILCTVLVLLGLSVCIVGKYLEDKCQQGGNMNTTRRQGNSASVNDATLEESIVDSTENLPRSILLASGRANNNDVSNTGSHQNTTVAGTSGTDPAQERLTATSGRRNERIYFNETFNMSSDDESFKNIQTCAEIHRERMPEDSDNDDEEEEYELKDIAVLPEKVERAKIVTFGSKSKDEESILTLDAVPCVLAEVGNETLTKEKNDDDEQPVLDENNEDTRTKDYPENK